MESDTSRVTLFDVQRHWKSNENEFDRSYAEWMGTFGDIVAEVSDVLVTLAGRKRLAENCSYLLLSKALNHALAMFSLIRRGLCVDAALTARNSVEALLLLELCATDSSEKLFRQWSDGKSFQPGWVRQELASRKDVAVRDVIISSDSETHEFHRFVYSWLSQITHANLRSLDYSVKRDGEKGFEVFVGGNIDQASAFINAMFAVVCHVLLQAAAVCSGIFSLHHLELRKDTFGVLSSRVDSLSKAATGETPATSFTRGTGGLVR